MKPIISKALLVLGGMLIGLLCAEGIARMIQPANDADLLFNSPDSSPQGLYVLNKETRLIPAPNFSDIAQSLGYKVTLRTNNLSLRGPSVQEINQKKIPQWPALGDSFTMAVQVSEKDTFMKTIRISTRMEWRC